MNEPTDLETLYKTNPLKACRKALAMTRKVRWQDRLEAIDKLLKTYGTEGIRGDWQNGYWCDVVAAYCNTGDTYALTVIHQRGETSWQDNGRFFVGTMGDFVERNQEKLGIV